MDIKRFLDRSFTAYHAVDNAIAMLNEQGFEALDATANWKLKKGGKYYVVKNGSALIAFVIGDLTHYAFNIAGSHTDSPCLKVKGGGLIPSPEGKRINVEEYGGFLRYSMMDIPLKVAGRVIINDNGALTSRTVTSDFNVNIPSLAIHHNSTVNNQLTLSVQNDMLPLLGDCDDLLSTLCPNQDVIDSDLYCVSAVECYNSGVDNSLICSPRIDNLTSVYSSINAIIDSNPSGVALACCFDNEEIGSNTKQGAHSAFLKNVLIRINNALGYNDEDFIIACNKGFILSVDNGHAVHPAHPEKSDPIERVKLGGGIVIKHHAHYSTDGLSSAMVKNMLSSAKLPYQDYYNNSDIRCGGTIGLITSTQLEMNACDIGLAQLAMHSAIETAHVNDVQYMQECLTAFFNSRF